MTRRSHASARWLGDELLAKGIVPRTRAALTAAETASLMGWRTGVGIMAGVMAASHKHGLSTIQSCPALVPALIPREQWHDKRARLKGVERWTFLLEQGHSLRELMETFKLPYGFRFIAPGAVDGEYMLGLAKMLADVSPSVLAQALKGKDFGWQSRWIRQLYVAGGKLEHFGREGIAEFDAAVMTWLAQQWDPTVMQVGAVGDVMDFILSLTPNPPNPKWTQARAIELAADWHHDMATRKGELTFRSEFGFGYDDVMKLPDGWPETFNVELHFATDPGPAVWTGPMPGENDPLPAMVSHKATLTAHALQTGRALNEEGARMHNCVLSYARQVKRGTSVIYGIRKGDERLATVELAPAGVMGFKVRQSKGPCNGGAHPLVLNVVSALKKHIVAEVAKIAARNDAPAARPERKLPPHQERSIMAGMRTTFDRFIHRRDDRIINPDATS